MTNTYHILMDNGSRFDVKAESAGEAIFLACHRVRGWCVKECFAGGDPDPELDEWARAPGRITFDIPPHNPLPEVAGPGRQRLCASYVREGDMIHDRGVSWIVREIEPKQVQIAFYCVGVGGVEKAEHVFFGSTLLTVTRPEPAESPAS